MQPERARRVAPGILETMEAIGAIAILAVCVTVASGIADSSRGLVALVAEGVFRGGAALLYFAPALVAADRRHPGRRALTALNALLGWTGIGWVALLVFALRPAAWSFGDPTGPSIPPPRKRCLNCRRTLGIEAQTCFHCGAGQADGGVSAR